MGHSLVGRVFDDRGTIFKRRYAQQPVVVRRLLAGRNSQPLVIRIEHFRHGYLGRPTMTLGSRRFNDTHSICGSRDRQTPPQM